MYQPLQFNGDGALDVVVLRFTNGGNPDPTQSLYLGTVKPGVSDNSLQEWTGPPVTKYNFRQVDSLITCSTTVDPVAAYPNMYLLQVPAHERMSTVVAGKLAHLGAPSTVHHAQVDPHTHTFTSELYSHFLVLSRSPCLKMHR